MEKYTSALLAIGEFAGEMFEENMIVFFGERANNGLEDYSVIIREPGEEIEICVGDTFEIGKHSYKVTAVGGKVKETFSTLGHFAARFDGADEAALPGSVHLDGSVPEIKVGDIVTFR